MLVDGVKVRIIDKPVELLALADETPAMGQWRSEWRSDFFQFTVGQYRQYVEAVVRASAGSKAEAERLETFFARQNIPVTVQEAR